MSENRYKECIDLIELYRRDIIQKALKGVIANKLRKAIEKANIDEELILDEHQPIAVKYEIEIDREFVAMAHDVFEQIIELLERKGTEDNGENKVESNIENIEIYDECNPYK